MKAFKFGLAVTAAGLLAILAVFFISPYWVLKQMHQAYENNQAGRISYYIDYPAVKASLKPQVAQMLNESAGVNELPESLQRWSGNISNAVSERAVEAFVNPQTLSLLLQGKELKQSISYRDFVSNSSNLSSRVLKEVFEAGEDNYLVHTAQPDMTMLTPQKKIKAQARYISWNLFEVHVPTQSGKYTDFLMKRENLRWKVIAVELPK